MKKLILKAHTKYSDNYQRIKHILNDANVSHKTKVRFALYCAESSMQYIDKRKYADAYAKATRCLELVGSWLIDENSVTAKELNDAASAAYASASAFAASSSAAYASAFAAYASSAASYAAHAAHASAAAAAYAHGGYNEQVYQQHMQRFYYYLIGLIFEENRFIKLILDIK